MQIFTKLKVCQKYPYKVTAEMRDSNSQAAVMDRKRSPASRV